MRVVTHCILLSALLLAGASSARAACKLGVFTEQNTYSLPGCPSEVKVMVDRMYGCIHWSGEEPYDAARAQEIDEEVTRLRCNSYLDDYSAIVQKYKTNAAVSRVLNQAFPFTE